MIVFEAVEQAHVQFVGGGIAEAYPGVGIGGDLAVPMLVAAVNEVVPPEDEQLVAEVVSHLIRNGRSNIWINEENLSLNPF